MPGIAFKVSPPTLKLLIHKQNLAYASSRRKLCMAVLRLGARYDEDSGFTAEKIFAVKIISTLNIDASVTSA